MNKNIIKDSEIDSGTLSLPKIASYGGYIDTWVPLASGGELHVIVKLDNCKNVIAVSFLSCRSKQARVSSSGCISSSGCVSSTAWLSSSGCISTSAWLSSTARISTSAWLSSPTWLSSAARISSSTRISSPSWLSSYVACFLKHSS